LLSLDPVSAHVNFSPDDLAFASVSPHAADLFWAGDEARLDALLAECTPPVRELFSAISVAVVVKLHAVPVDERARHAVEQHRVVFALGEHADPLIDEYGERGEPVPPGLAVFWLELRILNDLYAAAAHAFGAEDEAGKREFAAAVDRRERDRIARLDVNARREVRAEIAGRNFTLLRARLPRRGNVGRAPRRAVRRTALAGAARDGPDSPLPSSVPSLVVRLPVGAERPMVGIDADGEEELEAVAEWLRGNESVFAFLNAVFDAFEREEP
jgi:hypothetical protein